jgi:hypothetical protein
MAIFVVNTASGVSEDTGWLVGAKPRQAYMTRDHDFGYEYAIPRKDSVVGLGLQDSDFVDGGAEGSGHNVSASAMR